VSKEITLPTKLYLTGGGFKVLVESAAVGKNHAPNDDLPQVVPALLSLVGAREAVRALRARFARGDDFHTPIYLIDEKGGRLAKLSLGWGPTKDKFKGFTETRGNRMHLLFVVNDVLEGNVVFARSPEELEERLAAALTNLLPLPTHPSWARWWIRQLEELEMLRPLSSTPNLHARIFAVNRMNYYRNDLLQLLQDAFEGGRLRLPEEVAA